MSSLPIITTWLHLRNIVDDKHLPIQYEYNSDGYEIFAVDNGITYSTTVYNNSVPDPLVYSQVQNNSDKSDFLTNYAPSANHIMQAFAARDGYTVTTYPMLMGGSDGGTIARILRTDTSGHQIVVGSGVAGSQTGGVLTVQGDPSGIPIPITGSITANNASVGSNNASSPSSSTQIGGTDGTNLQSAHVYDTDTGGGTQYTLGVNLRKSASGGSVELGTSSDPVRIDPTGTTAQPVTDNGGSLTVDGTVTVSSVSGNVTVVQPTASNLNAQVQGTAADGASPVGNPVLIAGQDGTNVQSLATDGYGAIVVTGKNTIGTPPTQNPVVIGGWDGTNVVRLRLNTDGSVSTSEKELATFTALSTNTTLSNNKSLFSIVNTTGSTVIAKISSIYITSVQLSSITGVAGFFELHRIVTHSAGTAITAIETLDTSDALSSSITVRSGATVGTESANLLWRAQFSSDEWNPSTQLDVSAENHLLTTMFPVWNRKDRDNKPIVLRANEGLTVKFATNSSVGSFDIMVVFTQE